MKRGLLQIEFRLQEQNSIDDADSKQVFRFENGSERSFQPGESQAASARQGDQFSAPGQFPGQLAELRPELLVADASSPEGEFEVQARIVVAAEAVGERNADSDLVRLQYAVADSLVFGKNPQSFEEIDQSAFHGQDIDRIEDMSADSGGAGTVSSCFGFHHSNSPVAYFRHSPPQLFDLRKFVNFQPRRLVFSSLNEEGVCRRREAASTIIVRLPYFNRIRRGSRLRRQTAAPPRGKMPLFRGSGWENERNGAILQKEDPFI